MKRRFFILMIASIVSYSCTEEKAPPDTRRKQHIDFGHYTEVTLLFSSELPSSLSVRADDLWVAQSESAVGLPCNDKTDQRSEFYFERVSDREIKISNDRGIGCGTKALKLSINSGECQTQDDSLLFHMEDYDKITTEGFRLEGAPPSDDFWCPMVNVRYLQQ